MYWHWDKDNVDWEVKRRFFEKAVYPIDTGKDVLNIPFPGFFSNIAPIILQNAKIMISSFFEKSV